MTQTPCGFFKFELNTFETKMFDLGKAFTANVGAVSIDFAKKKITTSVKDIEGGVIFMFLQKIAEDDKRTLRIKYGEPSSYTIDFQGVEIGSHTFTMGDSFEVAKTISSIANQFGVSFNNSPMEHKIVFTFTDKVVK